MCYLLDDDLEDSWPNEGRVNFQGVSLAYDDLQEDRVLNNITFSTQSKEKVGIVGRTGAGKSSLFEALFRLTESCDGEITIDDIPIDSLGLHKLRSKISIIPQVRRCPITIFGSCIVTYNILGFVCSFSIKKCEFLQDPVLFTGTLRYNLDPFEEYSDEQLHEVLKEVDLHHAVQSLDYQVADGGSNFSVGQRQLVKRIILTPCSPLLLKLNLKRISF